MAGGGDMKPCACGCGGETRFTFCRGHNFKSTEHRAKVSKTHRGVELTGDVASLRPTARDLAWVAGFLEGEGSFFAQDGRWPQVSATQVQEEPLSRLAALLGGKVYYRPSRKANWKPTFWWRVSGPRARGVAMTVYGMMSSRRKEQIRSMLGMPA